MARRSKRPEMAMGKSTWLWGTALCGVIVVALSYVMPAALRTQPQTQLPPQAQLPPQTQWQPQSQTQSQPQPQSQTQSQPQPQNLKSFSIAQEEACKRDEDRLVQLRATQARDELIRFERELGCERLRPQLLRLRES